ncbi:MAG TPA: hypothetical protein VNE39_03380 [Planctomycetota bacterium]|nr:hypothetical protein [Planctomycetota bacterium]
MARKTDEGQFRCPVYEVLDRLCSKGKCTAAFFDHLKKAQVELLLAVRSVIDQRVEHLTREAKAKPRAQRIKVTAEE